MPANNNRLIDDLAKSVTTTTSLLEGLLDEIRDHSTSLALLKDKLASINESVSSLSSVVREGNGTPSIVTRLALLEKEIKDINEYIIEFKTKMTEDINTMKKTVLDSNTRAIEFGRQKTLSMWKLVIVVIPGLISLIIQLLGIVG